MSEPTFPHLPDLPPPPDVGSPGAEPARTKRRPRLLLGALFAVLALIAGLVGLVTLGREGSATARPLALSFAPGDRETYRLSMTMDGTFAAGGSLGEVPFDLEMTAVATWEVTEVDAEGVATIRVSVDELSGFLDGAEMPTDASQLPSFEMRVAPDGRVLEVSGPSLDPFGVLGDGSVPGAGQLPWMDQLTPLLPDGPVEPGDTWTRSGSKANAFGGELSYDARVTFERYEQVEGVRAAVIKTELTIPMDLTISFDDLLRGQGQELRDVPNLDELRRIEVSYRGDVSATGRTWVDVEGQRLLQGESSGTFDLTATFDGLKELEGRELRLSGNMTMHLERVPAGAS